MRKKYTFAKDKHARDKRLIHNINHLHTDKKVRCITNGKIYSSQKVAEKSLGLHPTTVSRSMILDKEIKGLKFELA